MPHKILVSNHALLLEKYGASPLERDILPAVRGLIDADRRRGITTDLCWLDSATDMARVGGAAVPAKRLVDDFTEADRRAYKEGVDAVFRTLKPHYLALLGGPDIVPHQLLDNPAFMSDSANGDDDEEIESDVPYASSSGFSRKIVPFVTPDRVVGRLPDVPGGNGHVGLQTFLAILTAAAVRESRPRDAYERVLAISALAFKRSTEATIRALFPATTVVRFSPSDGPEWPPDAMRNLLHFINCHGLRNRALFSGQDPSDATNRPKAHVGVHIGAHAVADTVVVAECCFGAQLFAPVDGGIDSDNDGVLDMSIAHEYLRRGAHCVFGSTSFSYGPQPDKVNDFADLICASFVRFLLRGHSTGEATLLARLEYAKTAREPARPLDPIDLKTLAQFTLVGDPSAHPVLRPGKSLEPPTMAAARGSSYSARSRASARTRRRRRAAALASQLRDTVVVSGTEVLGRLTREEAEWVVEVARQHDIAEPMVRRFAVEPLARDAAGPASATSYLIVDRRRDAKAPRSGVMITALLDGKAPAKVRAAHSK